MNQKFIIFLKIGLYQVCVIAATVVGLCFGGFYVVVFIELAITSPTELLTYFLILLFGLVTVAGTFFGFASCKFLLNDAVIYANRDVLETEFVDFTKRKHPFTVEILKYFPTSKQGLKAKKIYRPISAKQVYAVRDEMNYLTYKLCKIKYQEPAKYKGYSYIGYALFLEFDQKVFSSSPSVYVAGQSNYQMVIDDVLPAGGYSHGKFFTEIGDADERVRINEINRKFTTAVGAGLNFYQDNIMIHYISNQKSIIAKQYLFITPKRFEKLKKQHLKQTDLIRKIVSQIATEVYRKH